MAVGSDNRSEKPTQRKIRKAREKGQVARSKELPAAVVLLGVLFSIYYFGQTIIGELEALLRYCFKLRPPSNFSVSYISGLMTEMSWRTGIVLAPVLLGAVGLSVGANLLQGGLAPSWKALGFHFEKLSPRRGITRIFGKNGLVELVKTLFVLMSVSFVTYQVATEYIPLFPRLVLMDASKLLYWTAYVGYEVFLRIGVLLLIVAVADYGFQRYRFLEQLKMTKQERKDEYKETEGDPVTRGRIRRIQREVARRRMMAEVPRCDVVITNPTHYAVALSYKMEFMEAPVVVAKGVGFLALKIKELAQEHNIPLVENKALAQTLFKSVEVGSSIPPSLYKAVAEILAYVYRARSAWNR